MKDLKERKFLIVKGELWGKVLGQKANRNLLGFEGSKYRMNTNNKANCAVIRLDWSDMSEISTGSEKLETFTI